MLHLYLVRLCQARPEPLMGALCVLVLVFRFREQNKVAKKGVVHALLAFLLSKCRFLMFGLAFSRGLSSSLLVSIARDLASWCARVCVQ